METEAQCKVFWRDYDKFQDSKLRPERPRPEVTARVFGLGSLPPILPHNGLPHRAQAFHLDVPFRILKGRMSRALDGKGHPAMDEKEWSKYETDGRLATTARSGQPFYSHDEDIIF